MLRVYWFRRLLTMDNIEPYMLYGLFEEQKGEGDDRRLDWATVAVVCNAR